MLQYDFWAVERHQYQHFCRGACRCHWKHCNLLEALQWCVVVWLKPATGEICTRTPRKMLWLVLPLWHSFLVIVLFGALMQFYLHPYCKLEPHVDLYVYKGLCADGVFSTPVKMSENLLEENRRSTNLISVPSFLDTQPANLAVSPL